jgi:ABC-type amino acid transport substrate-binding protein
VISSVPSGGSFLFLEANTKLADFSQPYFLNQIGLVIAVKKFSFLRTFLYVVTSGLFGWLVLIIILLFLLYIHIFWFFERRTGYKGVEKPYWKGIRTSFWLATLGISFAELPTHAYTRLLRFIFFVAVILFFATLGATITSALTVALSNNIVNYDKLNDFNQKLIVAVANTAPYDLAQEAGLTLTPASNRGQAVSYVLGGKVAGYADYSPIASYYLQEHNLAHRLTLANAIIAQNTFNFAFPINSSLRREFDLQLISLKERGVTQTFCRKYFGEKIFKNCNI